MSRLTSYCSFIEEEENCLNEEEEGLCRNYMKATEGKVTLPEISSSMCRYRALT
jgi:hypothetical protein